MRIFIGTPEIDWILFKRGTRLTTPVALDGFRIFADYRVHRPAFLLEDQKKERSRPWDAIPTATAIRRFTCGHDSSYSLWNDIFSTGPYFDIISSSAPSARELSTFRKLELYPMPRKLIYFDRNIYNKIKNRLVAATADYDLIKSGVALGIIAIPGSITALEEALPLYRSKSPTLLALERQVYAEVMDWRVFIKYHPILLRDEMASYVNNTPFAPFTEYKITPEDVFTTKVKQSNELLQVVSKTEDHKNEYAENLKIVRQNFEQNIRQIPKSKRGQLTVSSLWAEQAKNVAKDYAARYGLINLEEPQIEGLLNLRSFGSVIRYDISYYYKKIKLGEKIMSSDSRDHHHVALSAVTDIFVTEDSQFAGLLELLPMPNRTVWSYRQFIRWLSRAVAGWRVAGLRVSDSYYARPWLDK
jgi:hypothetical protein